jgi:hypothetical protein
MPPPPPPPPDAYIMPQGRCYRHPASSRWNTLLQEQCFVIAWLMSEWISSFLSG